MKIIAVGMNYARHNEELGHTLENKEPVIFMLYSISLKFKRLNITAR